MEEIAEMFQKDPEAGKAKLMEVLKTAAEAEEKFMTSKMGQQRTGRIPLSRQRGVDKIPTFSGKEFLPFQKKLLGFCQDEPGCAALLKLVCRKYKGGEINQLKRIEIADEPDVAEILDETSIRMLNSEIHSLLGMVTSGIPWNIVDSTDGNGLEAWRLLCKEYGAVTSEGKRQILRRILNPPKATKYEQIKDSENEWNTLRAKYTELTSVRIAEDILVCAMSRCCRTR